MSAITIQITVLPDFLRWKRTHVGEFRKHFTKLPLRARTAQTVPLCE